MTTSEEGVNRFTRAAEGMAGKVASSFEVMARQMSRSVSSGQRDLGKLQASMAAVDAQNIDVDVDVDTTKAMAQLKVLKAEIESINAMKINVDANVNRGGSFGSRMFGSPIGPKNAPNSRGGLMRTVANTALNLFGVPQGSTIPRRLMMGAAQWAAPRVKAWGMGKVANAWDNVKDKFSRLNPFSKRNMVGIGDEPEEGLPDPGFLRRIGSEMASMGKNAATAGGHIMRMTRAALLLSPALESVLAGVMALGGSLGSGILGAGAGLTGIIGTGLVGTGGILGALIPASKDIGEANDALDKLQETVKKYGKASEEAAEARKLVNKEDEVAVRIVRKWDNFTKNMRQDTRAGRRSINNTFSSSISELNSVWRPDMAQIVNQSSRGFESGISSFWDKLDSPNTHRNLSILSTTFEQVSPAAGRIFANMGRLFTNIAAAATPQVNEFFKWFDSWMENANNDTTNLTKLNKLFNGWTQDFKIWMGFFKEFGLFFGTLLGAGREQGASMIEDLTQKMEDQRKIWESPMGQQGLDSWYDRQVSNFRKLTREIAALVAQLGEFIDMISRMLGPILDLSEAVRNLVPGNSLADSAASIFTLTAGYAGIKALAKGAVGKVFGAGAAGATGAGAGTAAGTAGGGVLRGIWSGRGGVPGTGMRSMIGRGIGKLALPATVGLMAYDFVNAPTSASGGSSSDPTGMSYFGTFSGDSLFERSASSLTGGLWNPGATSIPASALGGYNKEQAKSAISMQDAWMSRQRGPVRGIMRRGRQQLNLMKLAAYDEEETEKILSGRYSQNSAKMPLYKAGLANPEKLARLRKLENGVLNARIEVMEQQMRQLKGVRRGEKVNDLLEAQRLNVTGRGGLKGNELQRWTQSMNELMPQMMGQIQNVRGKPGQAKQITEQLLTPLREAAKQNPKLEKLYEDMTNKVRKRWSRMGDDIGIVNGKIYTGSKKEWQNISDKIGTEAERARQRASTAFTALQQQAIGSLMGMGYSAAEAKKIVQSSDASGKAPNAGGPGNSIASGMGNAARNAQHRGGRAMGGRIPGRGNRDTVPFGDGMAAPGELYTITNGHTEQRINEYLRPYGTSMAREISRENLPHNAPTRGKKHARGGKVKNKSVTVQSAGQLAESMGLHVGEGPGYGGTPSAGHATNSLHYSGLAYDISGTPDQMRAYFLTAWKKFHGSINELFYDPMGYYYDQGRRVEGAIGGHSDHVHIGFFDSTPTMHGGAMSATGAGGTAIRSIHLKGIAAKGKGIPGALEGASNEALRKGLEKKINKKIGAGGGGGAMGGVPGNLKRWNKTFAEHNSGNGDWGGPSMPFNVAAQIAEWAGLPGVTFAQIGKGESNLRPGATGIDPGGTKGLGWLMVTTGYNDALIAKYGGQGAMLNPFINAKAAKEIYDSNGIGAWYGTQYMTGTNLHYNGGYKNGGKFDVRRPTMFLAGEGNRPETVSVKPANKGSSRRRGGGSGVVINKMIIQNHREGDIRKQVDKEFASLGVAFDTSFDDDDEV